MSRSNAGGAGGNNEVSAIEDALLTAIQRYDHKSFFEATRYIIHNRLSVDFMDLEGFTPLLRAIDQRNATYVLALLLCGANKTMASRTGITPAKRIDTNTDNDAYGYANNGGGRSETPAMNAVYFVFNNSDNIIRAYKEICETMEIERVLGELAYEKLPPYFSKMLSTYNNRTTRNRRVATRIIRHNFFEYIYFLLYTYGCPGLKSHLVHQKLSELANNPRYRYYMTHVRRLTRNHTGVSNRSTRSRSRSRSRSRNRSRSNNRNRTRSNNRNRRT
jgi:hypothetical protein